MCLFYRRSILVEVNESTDGTCSKSARKGAKEKTCRKDDDAGDVGWSVGR